jgi:hypothetical protein
MVSRIAWPDNIPVFSIYIWRKNFSHSAYKKSEAKMAEIDVALKVVNSFNTIFPVNSSLVNSFNTIFPVNSSLFWRIVLLNKLSVHKIVKLFFTCQNTTFRHTPGDSFQLRVNRADRNNRKGTGTDVQIGHKNLWIEGYCRWKLSSGVAVSESQVRFLSGI